ncbi:hypothetical protein SteCoe_16453 [Stentor coeruleus]|uniref:NAD(+) ADP-ribosyltransferase n=1 Tax=Stentor coeruleus TaxID=5963 RepID=A0A1R2C1B0_9CILI|nr:hypothetical protein SteCoe_16453 [Stentor coeruleus]
MEITTFSEELQKACRLGDINTLKISLNENPHLLNQVDSKLKWSLLYRTVIFRHIEATEYLLQEGADPNIKNKLGETPLHQAAENSQEKLVKLLLEHKADPNSQQNDGNTPLHQSVFKGNEKIVAILLSYKADPNIPNSVFRKTPLHYAVEYNHHEIVKIIMNSGGNANIKDNTDKSPLDISSGLIRTFLIKSSRSLTNSPLLFPSAEPVEKIPSISSQIFNGLILSPIKNKNYIKKPSFSTSTLFEPDDEKSQLDFRLSQAFSFGGCDKKHLINWLESVKLDCLYDILINAGYDDIEQMASQMMSCMPITEENLQKIGIEKPGYRKRLLAALDEESRPYKSSRRTHRAQQSNPLKCCMVAIPLNLGFMPITELEKWLSLQGLEYTYKGFVDAGYDDLEHMLALMNTKWEITEENLMKEIGIKKQGHRYKILAKLKADSIGFDTMKKGGVTSRYKKDDLAIERNTNTTACSSCVVV